MHLWTASALLGSCLGLAGVALGSTEKLAEEVTRLLGRSIAWGALRSVSVLLVGPI